MSGATDKPQDKTNDRGRSKYLLNNLDLIVIAASVLIVFLAIFAFYSLKGNNIGCVCCEDTDDSELHCKRMKKIDLLEERIEELTKELQNTKQGIKEQGSNRPSLSLTCYWKKTTSNVDGGGSTTYLDRHAVDCGSDFLGFIHLVRPTKNDIQYNYKCCKMTIN